MLIALALAASLVAYVFVGGAVHRLLLRTDWRAVDCVEDQLAVVWPLIPALLLLHSCVDAAIWAAERVIRAGGWAADLPGRLVGRWRSHAGSALARLRRRGIHGDCATSWAWLAAGGDPVAVALGPCARCRDLIAARVSRGLPVARVVP